MEISEEKEKLKKLEKKIQTLVWELKPKIQDFFFQKEDFQLIKKDRSEKEKIFAKLPFRNQKIQTYFWERVNRQKKKVDPLGLIDMKLTGDVIIEIKQIFISRKIETITCEVKEVLLDEIEKPPSFFDDFEEISSSDAEED